MPKYDLTVNGRRQKIDSGAERPLLEVLREDLGLAGTKYGCGAGLCGACTVHVGGQAVRSCVAPVGSVGAKPVVTIEGLAKRGRLHPVQQAWIDEDVAQCGYCQTGQIMATVALLAAKPSPTEADVAGITNLCRCGTYPRVRKAIAVAAKKMGGKA